MCGYWPCFLVIFLYALGQTNAQTTVAQIPEQYPYTINENNDNYVPKFYYEVTPSSNSVFLTTTPLPTCGAVLLPNTVRYVLNFIDYQKKLNTDANGVVGYGTFLLSENPEYFTVPLIPKDKKQISLDNLATCNPFMQTDCTACVRDNRGAQSFVRVTRDKKELLNVECVMMEQVDCGVSSCPNGRYSTTFLKRDARGFVISKNQCLPCQPGTWLTCIDVANCAYEVPESPGTFEGGEQIYRIKGQDPVGSCFSCETAGNSKQHYGKTNAAIGIEESDASKWYCPGGDLPPVKCKPPYSGSNSKRTACSCPAGSFNKGGVDPCEICPAGYSCLDGLQAECPNNYYQDQSGASECLPCLLDGGLSNFCEISGKKMRKCVGAYKSQRPLCVQCNACRHWYESISAGVVDCY
jgi:hypothetical protein